MTPLSKQYVMHCRDATYSRKITLIIFHRIIAWKKTTRLNTIPIMFVMLRYCWLQIYSYFDQGCRKKCTRQSRKGIVGGFEGTVLQRNLKEWYRKPQTYVYEYSRKATKVGLTASVVSNSVLIISHISFQDCRMHISCDNFLETAVYMYTLYTIHSVWLKGIIILVCVVPDALSQLYFLTYHLLRVTIY